MNKKYTRSNAREEAFKLIFQLGTDTAEEVLSNFVIENEEMSAHEDYIKNAVIGVEEHKAELDDIIAANLKNGWKPTRLAKVILNILRLAVYEMKYVEDVPKKVAVNEAVELTKKYDEPKSAGFVNGVLGGVYKQLENTDN